jgi:hypothetical protein
VCVCVCVCMIVVEGDVGCVPFARANTVRALCLDTLRWTWERDRETERAL